MTPRQLHKDIAQKAGCANITDKTLTTHKAIKSDLTRRLKKQEKALMKTIEKGWEGQTIIEQSIINIKKTLAVLT